MLASLAFAQPTPQPGEWSDDESPLAWTNNRTRNGNSHERNTQFLPYMSARIAALSQIEGHLKATGRWHHGPLMTHRDVYQFGVYTGGGLWTWLNGRHMKGNTLSMHGLGEAMRDRESRVFGFDSFQGMPDEPSELVPRNIRRSKEDLKVWAAGGLNAAEQMGYRSWPEMRTQLIRNVGYNASRTHLIRGFYNRSLTGRSLAQQLDMRPAFLIDIDCDLYSSAGQALRFVLAARLLVPGTLVYYDDSPRAEWVRKMGSTNPMVEGEQRAHLEISKAFGLRWRLLDGNCTSSACGAEFNLRPVLELVSASGS